MPRTLRQSLKQIYLVSLLTVGVTSVLAQPTGMFQLDSGGGTYAHETSAAGLRVGSQNHVVATWNDLRENGVSHLGVAFTTNGFQGVPSFTERTNVIKPTVEGHLSVTEFDSMTGADPLTGDLYVGAAWNSGLTTDAGLFVARKTPTDLDFQPAVSVIRNPDGTHFPANDCHTPAMAIGPRPDQPTQSRIYITYLQNGDAPGLPRGYKITWSDDHAQTWTFPVDFPSYNGLGRAVPRVGPAGELYVCMHDEMNGEIRLGRSFDGGVVWQVTPTLVANIADYWSYAAFQVPWIRLPGGNNSAYRVPQWPSIAVSPVTGHLFCIFYDTTSIVGTEYNLDIYITSSVDQGGTWSTPVRLQNVPGMSDQFYPWIECDSNGGIHVVYYDTRVRTMSHGQQDTDFIGYYDTFYSYRATETSTWAHSRVTDTSWVYPSQFVLPIGFYDFIGMATAGSNGYPVFTMISGAIIGNGDVMCRVYSH